MSETVIELTGVEHSYGETGKALAGVNATIRRGEFIAVIGKNGSGKTTLAKHFNGLLRPTNSDGQVLVRTGDGELADPRRFKLHQLAPVVGYVFQNPDRQIFHDTCREELDFGPVNLGVDPQTTARRVAETLALVGLAGREEDNPAQLSRGERQRLAIASVLVMESDVAVIDEPTTGQDPDEARLILDCLARYQAAGHTVVIISHDMALVAQYATRVLAMQAGGILADDTPKAVFTQPKVLRGTNIRPPQAAVLAAELGLPGVITVDDAVREMRAAAQARSSADVGRI
ncbi:MULTISPECIES: ATP-binding cassette domain-containing protein [unclassified Actinopolyspora]|uniref:energy-coupling factor ABC transporter ATP-binding protein n=1 Tax=unclassified Actinopolyspora TaxID=2639451 RepID=UPI0013F5F7F2|nr:MULTISPECIES: ATP-binding cassette domain-containing protein [unclassified Actinopolyspora]NHD17750.1 ATP-binding cassette domain-containing protein [Actinopolyspora sp. BKK2]NHE76517.1 ATP-binding cassette domain-containing protein [Actinopolyspora sp. BKK1]